MIRVLITSAHFAINLQDRHHARKCSVHKSLLRGTCGKLLKVSQYHCRDFLCGYGLGIYLDNIKSDNLNLLLNKVDVDGGFAQCTVTDSET